MSPYVARLLTLHARACAAGDIEAAVSLARSPAFTLWEQSMLLIAAHHATPYEAELLRTEVGGGVNDVFTFALAWVRVGYGRGALRQAARAAVEGAWDVGLGGEEAA